MPRRSRRGFASVFVAVPAVAVAPVELHRLLVRAPVVWLAIRLDLLLQVRDYRVDTRLVARGRLLVHLGARRSAWCVMAVRRQAVACEARCWRLRWWLVVIRAVHVRELERAPVLVLHSLLAGHTAFRTGAHDSAPFCAAMAASILARMSDGPASPSSSLGEAQNRSRLPCRKGTRTFTVMASR